MLRRTRAGASLEGGTFSLALSKLAAVLQECLENLIGFEHLLGNADGGESQGLSAARVIREIVSGPIKLQVGPTREGAGFIPYKSIQPGRNGGGPEPDLRENEVRQVSFKVSKSR